MDKMLKLHLSHELLLLLAYHLNEKESVSDFLSEAHAGRSALGGRGDQHQESPAFRCCICSL